MTNRIIVLAWIVVFLSLANGNAQTLAPGVTLTPVAQGYSVFDTASFTRENLVSIGSTQYIAFYGVNTNVVVGRRQLGSNVWEFNQTDFKPDNPSDGHCNVNIGISGDGVLHCSWGMHNNPLNYARSAPWSLNLVRASMTGFENGVCYPQFIHLPNGDLLFLFREGGSGNGDTYLNYYSCATGTWTNLTSGSGLAPFIHASGPGSATNANAYPNYACIDANTNLVLTWCWREDASSVDWNHDECYARSPDFGATWFNWEGTPYTLPITKATAEVIWPISTNSQLMNQCGECIDTNNRPVIATYWAPGGSGTPIQLFVIWNDGTQWRTNQVGTRATTTWLQRPIIVCDKSNRLWMVYSDPESGRTPILAWTSDPQRRLWNFITLSSDDLGSWEPTYDPTVWNRDGKLDVFYQAINSASGGTPISVMEIDPNVILSNGPSTFAWTNANSGKWSADLNWIDGTAPPAGGRSTIELDFYGATSYATTNDLPGSFLLNHLIFNGSAVATNILAGNPLVFTNNGPTLPVLMQSGNAAFSIGNNLALGADLIVAANSAAPVFINGGIAGLGGITMNGGMLVLAGANSFSGQTIVNAGQLVAASSTALGSSPTNHVAGVTATSSLGLKDGITLATPILCSGRQPLPNASALAAHIINLSGTNTLTGDITADMGGNQYNIESAAGLLTISGNYYQISGTGPRFLNLQGNGVANWTGAIENGTATVILTKRGLGTWILSGLNTFTGSNVVSGGIEWVNGRVGPGLMIVNGGTLGGHGTITGSTDIQAGGTLAPACPAIATLTINNNLKFETGSSNVMELSGTTQTNDQLIVTGTLTFGGALVVTNISGNLTADNSFKLFNAAHYAGGFAQVNLPPLGVGLAWNTNSLISSGALSVIATASPQFTSLTLMGAGGFRLNGSGAAGVNYELDAATNLSPPINWVFVTNAVAGQDGLFQLLDSEAGAFPQRFYRIKSQY